MAEVSASPVPKDKRLLCPDDTGGGESMNLSHVPTLETERLRMRLFRESDVDAYGFSEPEGWPGFELAGTLARRWWDKAMLPKEHGPPWTTPSRSGRRTR